MRVLVTGATGFLGRWVTRAFVAERCKVRVLVRNPDRLGTLRHLPIEVRRGDVLARHTLEAALGDVSAIVHCAAAVSLRPRDRSEIHAVNVDGTRNVLEVAATRKLRVLHTSSIASVGPTPHPVELNETASRVRLSFDYPYAASKRESEDTALAFAAAGHDVVVLNPGIMLGPDDVYFSSTEFVMRYLRSQLGVHLSGGGSFCDVRDVARAYPLAMARARRGERYILAGVNRRYGEVLKALQLLSGLQRSSELPPALAWWGALASEVGAAVVAHPLEKFNRSVVQWGTLFNFCSAQKAERELGYRNRSFEATLVDTVVDQLERGAIQPRTPQLAALLKSSRPVRPGSKSRRRSIKSAPPL